MKVKEYIDSGILESYVLGSTSEEETRELLRLKKQYPEIQQALHELEVDMERIAEHMAIAPPPGMWNKIEDSINDLINTPEIKALQLKDHKQKEHDQNRSGYIDIEAETTHIRVHKNWKWIFAAVFILGKIFLAFAIYFYLENRQAQQQIIELKTELGQLHVAP